MAVINMSKNQKVSMVKEDGSSIKNIFIGVNWDANRYAGEAEIDFDLNVLPELSVTFRLGQEFTGKDYDSFDEVIVATGATNAIIPVPGKDLPIVTSAWDILAKKEIVFGNVSVIGGGLVGVETAEYLAAR